MNSTKPTTLWDFVKYVFDILVATWGHGTALFIVVTLSSILAIIFIHIVAHRLLQFLPEKEGDNKQQNLLEKMTAYSEVLQARLDAISKRNSELRSELDSTYEAKWKSDQALAKLTQDYLALKSTVSDLERILSEAEKQLDKKTKIINSLEAAQKELEQIVKEYRRILITNGIDPETGERYGSISS